MIVEKGTLLIQSTYDFIGLAQAIRIRISVATRAFSNFFFCTYHTPKSSTIIVQ